MWPFKKKKLVLPELPSQAIPIPKKEEEIELLAEDVPAELPALKAMPKPISKAPIPKTAPPTLPPMKPLPNLPVQEKEIAVEKPVSMPIEVIEKHGFIDMEKYKEIMMEINSTAIDFDNIEFEVGRVIELKDERNEKIDDLQDNLEEIGKKLMDIENTLFGG